MKKTVFLFFYLFIAVWSGFACSDDEPQQDSIAPVTGTGISFSVVGNTLLTVNWGAASDNVTAAGELQYKLVKASNSSFIDTAEKVNAIRNELIS